MNLLPCPFCDSRALVLTWETNDDPACSGWHAGCLEPDCDIKPFTKTRWITEQEAVDSWNRRKIADADGVVLHRLVSLIWSDASQPREKCHYNHTIAETPFGRFLLTWMGWKDHPDYGFDETPWGEVEYHGWNTIAEAQEWAAQEMTRRIARCFEANR